MNKRIELSKVKDVFRWTKEASIETFAYFIIGYIHETSQTIMRSISFAKKLDPDFAMFTVATPYPTTPLCDMAEDAGLVDKNYWRDFILGLRNDRLPYMVPDANDWVRRAYRSFYLRAGYIISRLLKIRSLHDIKRYLQAAQGIVGFKVSECKES
jgi:magnesium-protoporphyrin IX monomethyl ester (oxidative) cyclase